MKTKNRIIAILLFLALSLSMLPVFPVSAEDTTDPIEATEPIEGTEPTEDTVPTEATKAEDSPTEESQEATLPDNIENTEPTEETTTPSEPEDNTEATEATEPDQGEAEPTEGSTEATVPEDEDMVADRVSNGIATYASIQYSGTSGGCSWSIDSNGLLRIYPTNGISGTLANFTGTYSIPWDNYRTSIKQVLVKNGVVANQNIAYMFYNLTNCTEMDLSGLDTSKVTNMLGVFWFCSSLTSLDLSNWNTSKVTRMECMFAKCSSLTSLDLSNFDTSSLTTMGTSVLTGVGMFYGCSSLTSLNVSNFDTSNVTIFGDVFNGCTSLTSLDLSNWNTNKVTCMIYMFNGCSNLTELDLSNFNTNNVTSISKMFCGCINLRKLDLGENFFTSNVKDMDNVFNGCSKLTSLNLKHFDCMNVTNQTDFFTGCTGLTKIIVPETFKLLTGHGLTVNGWVKTKNVDGSRINDSTKYTADRLAALNSTTTPTIGGTWVVNGIDPDDILYSGVTGGVSWYIDKDGLLRIYPTNGVSGTTDSFTSSPWYDYNDAVTSVVVEKGVIVHQNAKGMFYNTKNCVTMDLSGLDTSNMTNMSDMFAGCNSLTNLNLSTFDTRKVTNMERMFMDCYNITDINISSFVTSNVTTMTAMFRGCEALTSLDVSNFDTSKVTSMGLSIIGNTGMFSNCSSLTSLDLHNFDTRNVTDMSSMFEGCSSLVDLDLSNFDTSNVSAMNYMFYKCGAKSLLLSNFDTRKVADGYMQNIFAQCDNLEALVLGKNFVFSSKNNLFDRDWVKTKNSDGSLTNDSTKYTTAELTTLNSSSTPSIGGTWVVNTPTTSLPLTGGSGRIVAVVVSVGLAGMVAVLVVVAKKKEKESKN